MVPSTNLEFSESVVTERQPSKTYAMLTDTKRIIGYTDELDAVRQAVFKILNTERYDHIIYSWDYGIQLKDLYGKPYDYCCTELERRITSALTWDDRIESVDGFSFSQSSKDSILVTFTVHSIFGDLETSKNV